MTNPTSPPASTIGTLLRDLRDETSTLLRKEVELAKTELSQKASRMVSNGVQVAVGGFVAYAGALVLLFGLADLIATFLTAAGLEAGTATWLSRMVTGAAIVLIGYLMLAKARKALSRETLVPRQTVDSLRDNKEWAQGKLHTANEQPL